MPNRDQIRYIGRTILDVPEVLRTIKGSREFNLKHRALNGDFRDIATKAGMLYEIDAFEIDLHAVHDVTFLPIGRLFVYFVVDVYSRAITGVYVTCDDPDYRQFVMALHFAFMPKPELGKLIGIEISADEWPMHGRAVAILGDGGEGAKIASGILPELGSVDIATAPPCRGDLKGQVEQTGDLADVGLIRLYPGMTKGPRQRCTEDPAKNAKITVLKLTQRLTEWSYKVHNNRDLTESFIDPELFGRGVPNTPNGRWKDSIRIFGPLDRYDSDTYLPRMHQRNQAKVTRWGLQLGDIYFDRPKDPIFTQLKEGATTFGQERYLAVHFDRLLTKQIYLVPKDPSLAPITVPLAHVSREWTGYTFKEVEDTIAAAIILGNESKNLHHGYKIDHSLKVDADVVEATEKIVAKYGSMLKRNKVSAAIGKDLPREEQLRLQIEAESKSAPIPGPQAEPSDNIAEAPTQQKPADANKPKTREATPPSPPPSKPIKLRPDYI
jgi:hypothetical protein